MTLAILPLVRSQAWNLKAACAQAGVPADVWARNVAVLRATAVHICLRHCPVRAECLAEVQTLAGTDAAYRSVVVGGLDLAESGKPRQFEPRPRAQCWICRGHEPPALLPAEAEPKSRSKVVQHGTEAGFSWHRRRHEAPCDACREGHRVYQYAHKVDARARAKEQAS